MLMSSSEVKMVVLVAGMFCVIAAYVTYCLTNPHADGMIFASVLAAVTALATKAYEKAKRWW